MQFKGSGNSGPNGRKAPTLAPLTEWRVPADGRRNAPADEPLRRRFAFWIGIGIVLMVLSVGAAVLFNKPDVADVIAATPVADNKVAKPARPSTTFTDHAPVELPTGLQIDRSSIFNYDLATWLATNPTTPRTFLSDRIDFDPGSAAIRAEDRESMQVLSQILTAYPQAKVTIVGNGPGSLGQERATAIRDALLALATDAAQLNVRAGDASEGAPRFEVKLEMGVGSDLDA